MSKNKRKPRPTHVILHYWGKRFRVQAVLFTSDPEKEVQELSKQEETAVIGVYEICSPIQLVRLGAAAVKDNLDQIEFELEQLALRARSN